MELLLSEGGQEENRRQVSEDGEEEATTETPEHGVGEEGFVEPDNLLPLRRFPSLGDHEPSSE